MLQTLFPYGTYYGKAKAILIENQLKLPFFLFEIRFGFSIIVDYSISKLCFTVLMSLPGQLETWALMEKIESDIRMGKTGNKANGSKTLAVWRFETDLEMAERRCGGSLN